MLSMDVRIELMKGTFYFPESSDDAMIEMRIVVGPMGPSSDYFHGIQSWFVLRLSQLFGSSHEALSSELDGGCLTIDDAGSGTAGWICCVRWWIRKWSRSKDSFQSSQ